MASRTVTASLTPCRPGTVQASVSPDDVGGVQQLEDLAHHFLLALPDDPDLAPDGLSLVSSGIMPTPSGDGPWVTVWAFDDESDGEGELRFTFNDGGNVPLDKEDRMDLHKRDFTQAERRQLAREHKALPNGDYPILDRASLQDAADLARTGHGDVDAAKALIERRARELKVENPLDDHGPLRKSDEDTPESLADELKLMESARRDEEDPEMQARMDNAIRHARRRYAAVMHPGQAQQLAKAAADDAARSVRDRPIQEAKAEIERRVRRGVPRAKAINDVSNERAHELLAA